MIATWLGSGPDRRRQRLLVIAALGLFLLPDALARQHAATKAGTLAIGLIMTGVALLGGTWDWWLRAAAIVAFFFVTLPVSSHMLARAAARELTDVKGNS
jgi:multicomponent Na+:H+ antiporter subunit G